MRRSIAVIPSSAAMNTTTAMIQKDAEQARPFMTLGLSKYRIVSGYGRLGKNGISFCRQTVTTL
jgi:hypothetical protein